MGFEQRAASLEEAYFHRVNQKLKDDLKKASTDKVKRQELATATGIGDEALLQSLVDQGISAESLVALSLVPVVAVAWADGKLDDKERAEILSGTDGIEENEVSGHLLNDWLAEKPSSELFEAWKSFAKSVMDNQSDATKTILQDNLYARCTAVAKAHGGTFGFGSISPSEQKMLDQIKAVLNG